MPARKVAQHLTEQQRINLMGEKVQKADHAAMFRSLAELYHWPPQVLYDLAPGEAMMFAGTSGGRRLRQKHHLQK